MFDGTVGWLVFIKHMHTAFVNYLYPIIALYIILYAVNLIPFMIHGGKK